MTTYQDALAAYFAKSDRTEAALAEMIGKSQPAVHRYRKGQRFPDADTARVIDRQTGGEVPFSVWQADFLMRSGLAA
tara:strand:- start:36 stop:266 length:231 start_codon:yes stop_codon:yes gene_type:complete